MRHKNIDRVMEREKYYDTIDAMQTDHDAYLVGYNTKPPYEGRGVKGRTTADVFDQRLLNPKTPKEEKMKTTALHSPLAAMRIELVKRHECIYLGGLVYALVAKLHAAET